MSKDNYETRVEKFIDELIDELKVNIRKIRNDKGDSLDCAADKSNMTKTTLINLEKHSLYVIVKSLLKLCIYYEKTLSELLGIDDKIIDFIKKENK